MSFGDEVNEPTLPGTYPPDDLAELLAQLIDRACMVFKDAARGEVPVVHDADELVRLAHKARAQVERALLEATLGRTVEQDKQAQVDMSNAHHSRADRLQGAA